MVTVITVTVTVIVSITVTLDENTLLSLIYFDEQFRELNASGIADNVCVELLVSFPERPEISDDHEQLCQSVLFWVVVLVNQMHQSFQEVIHAG